MATHQNEKSRFITILSLLSMMAALYSIVQSVSTFSMQNSAEFQLVKQFMPSAIISPTAIFVEIALNAAAIIASIGLYLRMNWGRIMFMVVLVLFTGWEIYSSISSYMALNALLSGYGFGGSLSLILVWSAAGIGLTIFLLWKLSSESIRSEFGRSQQNLL